MNPLNTASTSIPHAQTGKERILGLKEVKHRTALGKSTIYNMVANGTFPKQRIITARRVGWLESEIDKWIGSRM